MGANSGSAGKVESIKHKDKRSNIPTEELRDFVASDESSPKALLYKRDVSLDPQLVWKGKDEQDQSELKVPVVPIYIQEKVHPQAIVNDLVAHAIGASQLDLFADFNGGPKEFDQRIDFYNHRQNWTNRLILGDSLLVMSSLAEKEGLKGQVQMIYFDPPYGIKFGSNWQVSTRKTEVKDGRVEDATREPEQVRAFRDTWSLGIHSYLAYLRDRLAVARDLLTDSGSIFLQIGDENVHLVRCVMDEIFGSENYCRTIQFKKNSYATTELLPTTTDYLLWYAKDRNQVKFRTVFLPRELTDKDMAFFDTVELPDGERRRLTTDESRNPKLVPKGSKILSRNPLVSPGYVESLSKPIEFNGKVYKCPPNAHWKTTPDGIRRLIIANRLIEKGNTLRMVRYFEDFSVSPPTSLWLDTGVGGFVGDDRVYVVQTNSRVVERCILMCTDPGDLVFDPTCGSGTTATVSEQWGRRWITCDTSRVALALSRTRLMSAKYPYYLLTDSVEGAKKIAEAKGISMDMSKASGDIRQGFVYKTVPHVTLKAIANNPEIKEGMSRKSIEESIARTADQEILYDQPYEDKNRVRVAGPFSVESLSPHRVLPLADSNLDGTVSEMEGRKHQDFASMIIENLKKAGVQNTRKQERLQFEDIQPYAGKWIHAVGIYLESDGKEKKAAISIGPEHGTVGPEQVKDAAKEAVQGLGFDMLIVCGFAFDSHVPEEAKRYGNLVVLPAKMNPDLSMGDDLLKKTGAGNLFMVFGEPDIVLHKENEQIQVEIKGVDVYDPTTGQVRSSSTDDIACWFVDTDYNGESFFVRHAYFTGAEEPYEKLKKALRAEVDESAWASLYTTKSRAFQIPEGKRIAIKVINHYGDEVLKVFEVN